MTTTSEDDEGELPGLDECEDCGWFFDSDVTPTCPMCGGEPRER